MIEFRGANFGPIINFQNLYKKAHDLGQQNIEAACISTADTNGIPSSRMVNIKYIDKGNFIFFTNYKSKKGKEINQNNRIACVFFWHALNVQIRIEGTAEKISSRQSDAHFKKRDKKKNALAISSDQSKKIKSYAAVLEKYNKVLESDLIVSRPEYWGGYQIEPAYFEFWHGDQSRINRRECFSLVNTKWNKFYLEP